MYFLRVDNHQPSNLLVFLLFTPSMLSTFTQGDAGGSDVVVEPPVAIVAVDSAIPTGVPEACGSSVSDIAAVPAEEAESAVVEGEADEPVGVASAEEPMVVVTVEAPAAVVVEVNMEPSAVVEPGGHPCCNALDLRSRTVHPLVCRGTDFVQ